MSGLLAMVKPCMIVCDFAEIPIVESPTLVALFTWSVFGTSRQTMQQLRCLRYDAACMLHPTIEKMKKRSDIPKSFKELFNEERMNLMSIDKLHAKNHVWYKCVLFIDGLLNPDCQFHPGLPKFKEFYDCQDGQCEQTFAVWGPALKSSLKHSREHTVWGEYMFLKTRRNKWSDMLNASL